MASALSSPRDDSQAPHSENTDLSIQWATAHSPEPPGNEQPHHFTFRAVLVGLSIGVVMCFSNMYFGLQSGWISMMSLQSSLLGFAIFKPLQPFLRTRFSVVENVVLQTTAVATATMPLAAGFVGVIPALEMLTTEDRPGGPIFLSIPQLILWSLGVAFFGVFFAVPLRKQTIVREKLRFPSGTATAEMISLLHHQPNLLKDPAGTGTSLRRRRSSQQSSVASGNESDFLSAGTNASTMEDVSAKDLEHAWSLKLRALGVSFILSSIYTLLTYFFPIVSALPVFNWLTLNFVDLRSWEWYFTPSFSYVGQGIIMGLPTTLSMLLGCVVGWAILSPMAHFAGWAPGPVSDWKTGSKGWILWISLGVMIADAMVSLGYVLVRTLQRHRRQSEVDYQAVPTSAQGRRELTPIEEDEEEDAPPQQQVPLYIVVTGLVASTALCMSLIHVVFGPDILPLPMSLLAVAVAMLLSVLAVRALGETDLNPVSGIGKISQVIFALVMPGGIAANLVAGGISEAGAQQAGDLMQDLKTGHLLGASPRAQFYGQLIGSCVSAVVATVAYALYRSVYSIPGPEFPVPTAQVWLDMSRLVNGQPLPPHVIEFVVLFAFIFGVVTILKESLAKESRWQQYLPQGIAFAIGMYNPPNFTLARVIGGWLGYWWMSKCRTGQPIKPAWLETCRVVVGPVMAIVVASGFVLGEGTFAIVNMILRANSVPVYKA